MQNKTTKEPKKYALIQVPADFHKELKKYTEHHGYKIGGFVVNTLKREMRRNEKDNL